MTKVLFLLSLCSSIFFVSCFEKPKRIDKIVQGYSGEAARNPYLAAQMFLQKKGKVVEDSSVVKYDTSEYHAVCVPADIIESKTQVDNIRKFVDQGGHIVLLLENGHKSYSDFYAYDFSSASREAVDDNKYLQSLLTSFSLKFKKADTSVYGGESEMHKEVKLSYQVPRSKQVEVKLLGNTYKVNQGGKVGLTPIIPFEEDEEVLEYYADEGESHQIISKLYPHMGRITVISDARLFRNPHLGVKDHAELLLTMFRDDDYILFSVGRYSSFYELIWKYYPYALVALIVFIAVWLLSKYQRFGPTLQLVVEHPVNYLKSIDASGHFLWKNKSERHLISAIYHRADQLVGYSQMSEVEQQGKIKQLSSEMNISEDDISRALNKENINEPVKFIKTIQILQKIIQHHE